MDDFLKSLPNVADLIDLSKIVMLVLQCYGFPIIKWISNSPEILHSLPASEISKNIVSLDLNTLDLKSSPRRTSTQFARIKVNHSRVVEVKN